MNDAYDRFAPLTDGERSAHQMKERQKPDNDELVVPVPPGAPAPPASHTHRGKPIARWTYHNLMGEVLCYISRFDLPDGGKVFLPLTLQRTVRGLRWFWKALPEPRPLYGLDQLAARPEAPVLICEGEKAADSAQQIFPGHVAVTSPGGAAAASKADWESLRGRETVIWPDNDQSGAGYAREVAEILGDRECAVSVIDISQLVEIDGGNRAADRKFDGWDAADAIAGGAIWAPSGMRRLGLRNPSLTAARHSASTMRDLGSRSTMAIPNARLRNCATSSPSPAGCMIEERRCGSSMIRT